MMSHIVPGEMVDPETRNAMRKEIWTVLAQTGNYPDASSIEKSTLDFEGKIFTTCGASVVAYKKSIDSKLSKIRTAFIPPDFDSRRQRYVEWFNTNRHIIGQLQKRPDWNATISPNIVKYLSSPLNAQFINLTQLNELVAVKAEYTRLYAAAKQKYQQKKEAALPQAEAVRELHTKLQQASQGIRVALREGGLLAANNQSSEQKQGQEQDQQQNQPPLCQCLNLTLLHENMSCLSDFLTPFFMSKKKKPSLESSSQAPVVCRVCPADTGGAASGTMSRYMNLKEKFNWATPPAQVAKKGWDSHCSAATVDVLLSHIFRRLELLAERYLASKEVPTEAVNSTGSESGSETGTGASRCCVTSCFVRQQAVHFSLLEGWLQGMGDVLRRRVLPALEGTGNMAAATTGAGKKTRVAGVKSTSTADSESEKKLKNAETLKYDRKRALNLVNYSYSYSKRKRLPEEPDAPVPEGSGSLDEGEMSESGVAFSSLEAVLSALEQRHSVRWTAYPPESISGGGSTGANTSAGACVGEGPVQGLRVGVRLHQLCGGRNATTYEDENMKCNIHIMLDEQSIPLYATASLGVSDADQLCASAASTHALPTPPSFLQLDIDRAEATISLPVFEAMNEFLVAERRKYASSPRGRASASGADSLSAIDVIDHFSIMFNILSVFTAHFQLSDANATHQSPPSDQATTLSSHLHVDVRTGHVSVTLQPRLVDTPLASHDIS